jgi:hypothetical protein
MRTARRRVPAGFCIPSANLTLGDKSGDRPVTIEEVRTANQQTADRLIAEARRDPRSPYLGKFGGIANGQIVVVADDWDELVDRLTRAVPDLCTTLSLEVGVDYDRVQYFWGVR